MAADATINVVVNYAPMEPYPHPALERGVAVLAACNTALLSGLLLALVLATFLAGDRLFERLAFATIYSLAFYLVPIVVYVVGSAV
jgi:hypothetical protein